MAVNNKGTTLSSVQPSWRGIDYLLVGSEIQRRAYAALHELGLPDVLARFDAELVGTIPLDLGGEGSDLELLCEVQDLEAFQSVLKDLFGDAHGFWSIRKRIGESTGVASWFSSAEFGIGILGEPIPVRDQPKFRLTAMEERLLRIGGEPLRQSILDFLRQGAGLEFAFASVLGLPGDPREALLGMESTPEIVLEAMLEQWAGRAQVNSD